MILYVLFLFFIGLFAIMPFWMIYGFSNFAYFILYKVFGYRKKVVFRNLEKAFPDNSETEQLDIIFIAGDVFDTLMFLSADDVGFIKLWIAKLLRLAAKYNIIVRVLEGTPSHDRKQSLLFPLINGMAEIKADVRHITEIYIEHIEKHNINVLYIPDEATATPEKTYEQVIELMSSKGLAQVDFAIMQPSFLVY